MPGEPELELGDVPAPCADGQRTGAELRLAEPSERLARARPDDAVGLEPLPLLEREQRLLRLRPAPAVDRTRIRVGGPQRHLQRGDVGAAGSPGSPDAGSRPKRTDRAHRCGEKRTYHPYSARRPITLIVGCL